jgi:hypothetical protein
MKKYNPQKNPCQEFYKIYVMFDKFLAIITKFKTLLVSIAIILILTLLSFFGWKLYRWIYPAKINTIENVGVKNAIKIDSNKNATQVLPEAKHLDETIEDILSTM